MKNRFYTAIIFASALSSFSAHASSVNACVLEGKGMVGGQILDIKDCAQRTDDRVSEQKLKEMCSGLSAAAQALGGPPAKITYAAACPTGAQAHCMGVADGMLDFSYYKRSESDFPDMKGSCELMGGKWK